MQTVFYTTTLLLLLKYLCLVMLDNDYEIGEEPEKTWGWNKFKGKPKKRGDRSRKRAEVSGWISKRKKLTGMIGQCSEIFKKAGHEEVTKTVLEKEAVAEKETKELESVRDSTLLKLSLVFIALLIC